MKSAIETGTPPSMACGTDAQTSSPAFMLSGGYSRTCSSVARPQRQRVSSSLPWKASKPLVTVSISIGKVNGARVSRACRETSRLLDSIGIAKVLYVVALLTCR